MEQHGQTPWSDFQKWLFQFSWTYILIYILPIPWGILGLEFTFGSLSGEVSFLLFRFGISFLISIFWFFSHRERADYSDYIYWYKLSLRVFLFVNMMAYGFAKTALIQFSFPPLFRLVQPLHELTGMNLMWAFMGYSATYQAFTGLLEVAGGFLMLFRRTTTLGALLIAGVMSNVALMNFVFDIPVKNLSTHLLVFALILASFDYRRILNTFILNNDTKALPEILPVQAGWYHSISQWIKWGMSSFVLIGLTISAILPFTSFMNPDKPALYGIYGVSQVSNDWEYLIIDRNNQAYIRSKQGESKKYRYSMDEENSRLTLTSEKNKIDSLQFHITRYEDTDRLKLVSISGSGPDELNLQRIDETRFRLMQ